MECINFEYSTKNIPIPSEREYTMKLIEMTEHFLKRIRWKAFYYLHPEARSEKETYGFKSRKSPPSIPELASFEKNMTKMIQSIEFKQVKCRFQNQLKHDIKNSINSTKQLIIPADKTSNFYKLEYNKYNQLLHSNVTKDYKKADSKVVRDIKAKSQAIAKELKIDDRVMKSTQTPAFITLKDHKDNFINNPSCRLINPSKPEIGRISKGILERINKNIVTKTKANLWQNTNTVIQWFNNIKDKHQKSFLIFDIVSFYPSITAELLKRALDYAADITNITSEERNIIMEAKRSTLHHNDTAWSKKRSEEFDITMGSYDGAESCELVGLYMLNIIKQQLGDGFGLYRDDGLAAIKATPRQAELTKKKLCKIFKEQDLQITVEANKKVVNYLDVSLDLTNNRYHPYLKPNNTIKYVHRKSNHPPSITKNLPLSINNRLSNISSDENAFNNNKGQYQEALTKSGYNYELEYQPNNNPQLQARKRKKRDIIWYNPPYSKNVATKIGKKFLRLINEEFNKDHVLHKILNKNTVKLSYCCMNNMKAIINKHNRAILNKQSREDNTSECNCRRPSECPLNGKCKTSSIVYQATVTSDQNDNSKETYIGLTENSFKTRYNNHKTSFNNEDKRTNTELSNHIWKLKDKGSNYNINWKIITRAKAFNPVNNSCNLCTAEKYYIVSHPSKATLNERREIITTCRHSHRQLLCS